MTDIIAFPEFILELVDKGHQVVLVKPTIKQLQDTGTLVNRIGFLLDGFGYKENGMVVLLQNDEDDRNSFSVAGRYDCLRAHIESYDDLVLLNYFMWLSYRERHDPWLSPDQNWVEDMKRLGLIQEKKTVTFVPTRQ